MNKFHQWEDFLGSSIDGWQYNFLGELFSNRQEKNRPELPLLAVTGSSGVIDRDKLERRDTSNADKSKYLRVATGDIVYNTMRMWQGVSGSAHKDGIVSPAYTVATPTNLLDKKFAKYLVKNELLIQKFHQNSQGLVNDTLNLKFPNFASIHVQVPPLPEQKKIASILTSVDEVIENTQKQIDKLQDLKKATMNELLTKGIGHTEFKDSELGRIPKSWDVVSVSDLAFIDRESLSSSTSPDYRFFYIDITSVKTCLINIPPTKIKYGDSPSRARRVVRKGDVLLSTVRPNLKAFAYVENDCLDWVCSTGFSVLSPKDGNDGRFIFYSVLSEFVTKQIEALVVGSNYPAINSVDVKSLLVLHPSLSEQRKIAAILNSIETAVKDKQEKLQKTQFLKKSVMQDLLTGKVRVKVN